MARKENRYFFYCFDFYDRAQDEESFKIREGFFLVEGKNRNQEL